MSNDNHHVQALVPHVSNNSMTGLTNTFMTAYDSLCQAELHCQEAVLTELKRLHSARPPTTIDCRPLIRVHMNLLEEFSEFFLTAYSPLSTSDMQAWVVKHNMPSRMWCFTMRDVIYVLNCYTSDTIEHVHAFVHRAYKVVAGLVERVPSLQFQWIECLGNLARHLWSASSDVWIGQAFQNAALGHYESLSVKRPTTGRLYHKMASLKGPACLEQLAFYLRDIISLEPFDTQRSSLRVILDAALHQSAPLVHQTHFDYLVIKFHALLLLRPEEHFVRTIMYDINSHAFVSHFSRAEDPVESGIHFAISITAALLNYGHPSGETMYAADFASVILQIAVGTPQLGTRLLPVVHVIMIYFWCAGAAQTQLSTKVPWAALCDYMNSLATQSFFFAPDFNGEFPGYQMAGLSDGPLKEDWLLNGVTFTCQYFPTNWFIDRDEHRRPCVAERSRKRRVVGIGYRIASVGFPWCGQ